MREKLEGVGGLPPLRVLGSILGVGTFALGQPLLDLVGRNPEFFIARRFPAIDIALLVLALLAAPLLLALPVFGLRAVRKEAGALAHLLVLAALGAVAVAAVLRNLGAGDWSPVLFFGVAGITGVSLALLYGWFAPVRTGVFYLAIAPLAVVLWLGVATPVSALVFSPGSEVPEAVDVDNPVPVVMVVYDEFPLASMMRPDGSLHSDAFPSFARLASDGVWYRNALAVHQQTEEAVPAILTGRVVSEGSIPSTVDYPFTLFSLLSEVYDVQAVENVTQLCPPYICSNVSRHVEPPAQRWTSVTVDLAVVYGHVVLPDRLSSDLPPIDQGWGDFGQVDDAEYDLINRFLDEVSRDRRREVSRFLSTFEDPGPKPPLRFGHFLYPHHPWELTADGRVHGASRPPGRDGIGWGDDEFLVAQGLQHHLIQARYADSMLGGVLDQLDAEGIYEEAMVVVVADHGIAIGPGVEYQRLLAQETVGPVGYVPLFVKYPESAGVAPAPGTVDDIRAETVDILPTVADVLGVDVPWSMDGVSLLGDERDDRSETVVRGSNGAQEIGSGMGPLMEVVEAQEGLFPGGDPYRLTPDPWGPLLGEVDLERIDQADLAITLEQAEALQNHRAGDDPVPAFLSGQVESGNAAGEAEIVAVTADDEVVSVTRTFDADGVRRWEAMVEPEVIDEGRNVEAWVVRGSPSDPVLTQ